LGGEVIFSHGTEEQAEDVFRTALRVGVRYIDTAHDYANSQSRLGRFLKGVKEPVFLATKSVQRNKDNFLREVDENIELLGRTPDLLHVHAIHKGEAQEVLKKNGALEAALEARNRGLCSFVGLTSHDDPDTLEQILRRSEGVDAVMVALSAGDTRFAENLLRFCNCRDIGVVAMKVMGRGRLVRPEGYGVRTGGQALRFALSYPVSLAIVGFTWPEEVGELAEVVNPFEPMTQGEMAQLYDAVVPNQDRMWWYRSEIGEWDEDVSNGMTPRREE
jgi:hypothetical protein